MFYNIHVCNVVMSLLILLNIVNIVVLPQEPTFLCNDNKDNVRQCF